MRNVEGLVFKLISNVSQLKRLVDLLGTPKDTVDHRHKISSTNVTIQDLAKTIKEQLTRLHEDRSNVTPEQQLKSKKLLQDFANTLQVSWWRLAQSRNI